MVNAEIISIGDELLNGQTINTNASWLGVELANAGINPKYVTTIGDNKEDILHALNTALSRTQIILITGGLGPTKDDITKHTLAEYFNTKLIESNEILKHLEKYYSSKNKTLNSLNKTQALLPEKCTIIPNLVGTASGMWFEKNGKIITSMPGVPREMKKMVIDTVLPNLSEKYDLNTIEYYFIKTVGIAESSLAIKLENWEKNLPKGLKLAYLPALNMVKLRLTNTLNLDYSIIEQEILKVRSIIGEYIYSYNEKESLEESLGKLLIKNKETLSTAESCTGGYLSHLITSISGSSEYYQGSVVSYSNQVKNKELSVSNDVLAKHGAVSEETIKLMAQNCKNKFGTTYALATSGIAGPDGGSEEKPVGTIWIAIAYKDQVKTKLLKLNLRRKENIHLTAIASLDLLRQTINEQLS